MLILCEFSVLERIIKSVSLNYEIEGARNKTTGFAILRNTCHLHSSLTLKETNTSLSVFLQKMFEILELQLNKRNLDEKKRFASKFPFLKNHLHARVEKSLLS